MPVVDHDLLFVSQVFTFMRCLIISNTLTETRMIDDERDGHGERERVSEVRSVTDVIQFLLVICPH